MKKKRLLLTLLTLLCFLGGARAQSSTLTVYEEATGTSQYVPIEGYWADSYQKCEFVIPASELGAMAGTNITKMTFYLSTPAAAAWGGTFQVFLKEVGDATISAYSGTEGATVVYTGTLNGTESTMDINFDVAYAYTGSNLLVGVYQTAKGSYQTAYFAGEEVSGASIQGHNGSSLANVTANQQNFIPKTTFTYTSGAIYNKPTNLSMNDITKNSATISWTAPAGATGYIYQYKETLEPEEDFDSNEASTTATSVTLNGLSPQTAYDFRIKAIYSGGESDWATINFTTDCDAKSLPYTEGFEYGIGCWSLVDCATNTGINSGAKREGSYGFKFAYNTNPPQYLISPELTGTGNGVEVSFYYKKSGSYTETFMVGYSTTSNDPSAFTWDTEITAPADWTEYNKTFPAGTKYVAVKYTANDQWALYIDDFSFNTPPSCIKPLGLTVNYTGDLAAELSWTSDATAWQICINDDEENLIDVTTNPYTLTGLTLSTDYSVKIRTDCGGGDYSTWTSAVNFTTNDCMNVDMCNITYELEANAYQGAYDYGWYYSGIVVYDDDKDEEIAFWTVDPDESTATGVLPVCNGKNLRFEWYCYYSEANDNILVGSYNILDASGNIIASGEGPMSANVNFTMDCDAILIPTNLATTEIGTTSAKLNWEGSHDSYVLQYRTAAQATPLSVWHQVGDDVAPTNKLKTYTFDLSDYSGTGAIAIRHYNVSDMYYVNIDDIVVTNAGGTEVFSEDFESGSIPATWSNVDYDGDGYKWSIRTTTGQDKYGQDYYNGSYCATSASWNSGALHPDNWLIIPDVELGGTLTLVARGQDPDYPADNFGVFVTQESYDPVSTGSWSSEINTTAKTYQLTDLSAGTPYEWQVKGILGTDESNWATSTFTTIQDGTKTFVTDGNWNVAENWFPAGVPTATDAVTIDADVIIPSGVTAVAKRATIGTGSITIEDGAQLKQGAASLKVTMLKEIDAASNGFITSPFNGRTHIGYDSSWSCVDDPTDGDFDFYAFDGTAANGEWINYEYGNNSTTHEFFYSTSSSGILWGEGYFYANDADMTLEFTGTTWSSLNNSMTKDVTYSSSTNPYNGWRLIGNPYTCTAYVRYLDGDDNQTQATFYKLNAAGDGYDVYDDDISLAPGEVAFIQVTESGKILYSSEDLGAAIEIVGTETAPLLPALGVDTDQSATGITINMNSFGIMTYASPYQLDFNSTDDLTAYAATDINTENLTMTQVLVAPAEAGLLLKGTADASYVVRTSNATADDLTNNKLVGVLAPTPVTAEHVYILANGTQGINWYPLDPTDNTIGANKAYLQLTATEDAAIGGDGARGIGMIFDDGTSTAINLINSGAQNNENGMWYTLQGLRLDKKPTTKGVYIHNGKKVVIK